MSIFNKTLAAFVEAVRESAAEATATNQAARVAKATQAAHGVVTPKPVVTDSATAVRAPVGIGERMLAAQQVHHSTIQRFVLFQSIVLMLILRCQPRKANAEAGSPQ